MFRGVIFVLLAVDGVISAVIAALLVQTRLGGIPFPVSALAGGLVNAALVWVGLQWTASTRLAALSLWTWLLTVAVLAFGGPGSDVVFGGRGVNELSPLPLLVLGLAPPVMVLWRRRLFAGAP